MIKTPANIDSNKIVKHAYSRYNLSIGIGLSQVRCQYRSSVEHAEESLQYLFVGTS